MVLPLVRHAAAISGQDAEIFGVNGFNSIKKIFAVVYASVLQKTAIVNRVGLEDRSSRVSE